MSLEKVATPQTSARYPKIGERWKFLNGFILEVEEINLTPLEFNGTVVVGMLPPWKKSIGSKDRNKYTRFSSWSYVKGQDKVNEKL